MKTRYNSIRLIINNEWIIFLVAIFILFSIPVSGTGREALDIRYAERRSELPAQETAQDRLLNIYYPETESPTGGYPVVMFIHGGGFAGGSRTLPNKVISALVSKGYAVVSISYILKLKGTGIDCTIPMRKGIPESRTYRREIQEAIDEAAYDAMLAMEWISFEGGKYELNTKSIAVCGGSAGACTALALGYAVKPRTPKIRAVVNLWGAMADPGSIKAPVPPLLTIHGMSDDLINYRYGVEIDRRMREIWNSGSRLILLQGRGHAQYNYVGKELSDIMDKFLKSSRIGK